ncbi:MAG: hypothetical protein A2836_02320 [Candidatus Taylorbacteria bacterium RIFCSPHIGHO2_01_FULL_45_63]|uniref:Uncharacterized protein n=1 Tax=Candidatus Taylorbacteria bacterium RIFCSPHIGHO2_02_FULL_45_35 TaxID=1802311 RepID=A0A1G2MU90_9BACT|nr:MAG: hypothetical protein A2836_02320 [Candidatus Taylorbacteria bacterium RIFCSPHIGHO2_01_FULL_45_63]OHA27437.1 MAG: hypothetical protein A3D56_00570 [Candidatus Taylorbacteria bacterium RIFCSPHIGHO2_02_FULL_45_35]OHA33644.1 MAG: hypothetical protein A3A22_02205 [Candidatus Taylorbacteria bacterium RIFCSPLOWO2_01_FULL_45_34b]
MSKILKRKRGVSASCLNITLSMVSVQHFSHMIFPTFQKFLLEFRKFCSDSFSYEPAQFLSGNSARWKFYDFEVNSDSRRVVFQWSKVEYRFFHVIPSSVIIRRETKKESPRSLASFFFFLFLKVPEASAALFL